MCEAVGSNTYYRLPLQKSPARQDSVWSYTEAKSANCLRASHPDQQDQSMHCALAAAAVPVKTQQGLEASKG